MKKILIYGNKDILTNYQSAVEQCGAYPSFLQNSTISENFHGLLLAGGGDIHPALYGQKNTASTDISVKRDLDEMRLIHIFIKRGLPILGICRGIQILNAALGGTLHQDIETADQHRYLPQTGDQAHSLNAENGSFLEQLYGKTFFVNSAHHQAIDKPGKNLRIDAVSPDGIIEAVSIAEKNIFGVQFHPERMAFSHQRKDTADGRYLIEHFLKFT